MREEETRGDFENFRGLIEFWVTFFFLNQNEFQTIDFWVAFSEKSEVSMSNPR